MTTRENLINKCILAKEAGKMLAVSTGEARNRALVSMAESLEANEAEILKANEEDIKK